MCKVLEMNRSTYYKILNHKPSARELENQELDQEILIIYYESKRLYGAPKIHETLIRKGFSVSLKRVQRRMTSLGIRSIVIKKYRHYSKSDIADGRENLLDQDFNTTAINQKWCTDITYIHTIKDGWTYLASVMDLHSKKIIGWAYDITITAELAKKAVENACLNVSEPKGIILHSDLGTQYTSDLFEEYMAKQKIKHSFSKKGCPYDNACIESFHSILKKEEVHRKTYIDLKDAYQNLFEYIESWYYRKRIHSSIDYLTPSEMHAA